MNGLFVSTLCLNNVFLTFVFSNKYFCIFIHDKHQVGDMRRVSYSIELNWIWDTSNHFISEEMCLLVSSKHVLWILNKPIFKSFLCNVYGHHLWSMYKQYSCKHVVLVVAFNDIDRKLFGIQRQESTSVIYVSNNIDSFGMLVCNNFTFMYIICFNVSLCIFFYSEINKFN